MAPAFSVLAWRIPCLEEPGGLQSRGRRESDTTDRLTLGGKRVRRDVQRVVKSTDCCGTWGWIDG